MLNILPTIVIPYLLNGCQAKTKSTLSIKRQNLSKKEEFKGLMQDAQYYSHEGDLVKEEEYYKKAIEMAEKDINSEIPIKDKIEAYLQLSYIFNGKKEIGKQEEFLKKGILMLEKKNLFEYNYKNIWELYLELGILYQEKTQIENAKIYYQLAINIMEKNSKKNKFNLNFLPYLTLSHVRLGISGWVEATKRNMIDFNLFETNLKKAIDIMEKNYKQQGGEIHFFGESYDDSGYNYFPHLYFVFAEGYYSNYTTNYITTPMYNNYYITNALNYYYKYLENITEIEEIWYIDTELDVMKKTYRRMMEIFETIGNELFNDKKYVESIKYLELAIDILEVNTLECTNDACSFFGDELYSFLAKNKDYNGKPYYLLAMNYKKKEDYEMALNNLEYILNDKRNLKENIPLKVYKEFVDLSEKTGKHTDKIPEFKKIIKEKKY